MTVAIVGLGYVGLPLAHAIARKTQHTVVGYDISSKRIAELKEGKDRTGELTGDQLKQVQVSYSDDSEVLKEADVIILAIPTPVDEQNDPDLTPLISASATVGKHLKKGAIVVYESTVYPGTTEEICGPILAEESGLTYGVDFTVGYSPERINPGDKEHTVEHIMKIVSGQDEKTTDVLSELYGAVTDAGVHRAPNIKVAEMAKAIENAQRDLNIAFINEIAKLCHACGITTKDVLDAAATKWNFLRFSPGLVGGHCIGVDPYYLVEKAKQLNMETQIISAGRAINDGMANYVADEVNTMLKGTAKRVLVLGLTFKENVPDTRNSKSGDVVARLKEHGHKVEVHDPYMDSEGIKKNGWTAGSLKDGPYDAVVLLVPHKEYLSNAKEITGATAEGGVIYDLKSVLSESDVVNTGRMYRAL